MNTVIKIVSMDENKKIQKAVCAYSPDVKPGMHWINDNTMLVVEHVPNIVDIEHVLTKAGLMPSTLFADNVPKSLYVALFLLGFVMSGL